MRVGWLLLAVTAGLFAGGRTEDELRFLTMAQAAYSEEDVNAMVADFTAANPGVRVRTEFVPYEELRTKTLLSFGSSRPYDLVAVDDIWFDEYIQKKLIAEIGNSVPESYLNGIHPGSWYIPRREGKIYGLPWILDTMFLFSNRNMLNQLGAGVPKNLNEFFGIAEQLKAQGVVKYPLVLSLSQAEALICVYGTFLLAYGGTFQDQRGNYLINTPPAIAALRKLLQLKRDGLLNPNSLEYLEEDVRRVFSNGDAAFALNWTYMYALANGPESQVANQVAMSAFPSREGSPVALSGSMGLGVISKSNNPELATKLALYLASKEVQERYSRVQLPAWQTSFDQPEVRRGREQVVDAARQAFQVLQIRPSEQNYQAVSLVLQKHIQSALLEEVSPEDALNAAMAELSRQKP